MISTTTDVQSALNELGYGPLATDGIIGPLTTAAVKKFQADHSLSVDGDPGPMTKAALVAALAANGSGTAQALIAADNAAPPTNVVATHIPPTINTPAATLHVNAATGSTTTKPFGTPTSATSALSQATGAKPTASAPLGTKAAMMPTSEKVGIAAVLGLGAWWLFGKKGK